MEICKHTNDELKKLHDTLKFVLSNNLILEIAGWIMAAILSFLMLNILTMMYYHPVHELQRSGGATPGLKVPHQWGIYGNEGWGIQTIDSLGYVNPDLPLEDEYYCVIGSSHSEGFHSMNGERYSDLLNEMMGYDKSLKVYNIAHSGYHFDGIAKHFSGIVSEFPGMKGVIIELEKTNYSIESLEKSLVQVEYDNNRDSVEAILSKLSKKERVVIFIKNYFPVLREIKHQIETYKTVNNDSKEKEKDIERGEEYEQVLNEVMSLIRSEYGGEIIVIYHPKTTINSDGSLDISVLASDKIFMDVCEKNGIKFINMASVFEREYYEKHHAMYGFWNTSLMSGHINKYCHEVMAEVLYEIILER